MTGPFVPVGILNPIRAVVGIPHYRFNLFVECSRATASYNARPCSCTRASSASNSSCKRFNVDINDSAAVVISSSEFIDIPNELYTDAQRLCATITINERMFGRIIDVGFLPCSRSIA
jgi:hypothetical protein